MALLLEAYQYLLENQSDFWHAVNTHLLLSFLALGIGVVICVPLGIYLAKTNRGSMVILNAVNIGRIIPSLAVLALAMPYIGVGFGPSLLALSLLVCPPILINTVTAFRELDKSVIEAAYGMGMDHRRVLRTVEIPLALPVIITGIKTAAVEVIASAALAAFIGGGGLGEYILNGIALAQTSLLLVGAIPIAILALLAEVIFGGIEKWTTPPLV
ncbi:ABC transporter permease [Brevibacillus sp. SYP-B805]|uniref:ABC transporter permease n=1 Tax=Brevibacillus sp. SYP-B805 TaxID=1578199 RepID=UPI0013EB4F27|nr:ABC transporter permease [Brevibacillus sp. SYP-B805]NGQ94856.1 ABC transporter permease [Brevibacillus sp. SYP-B805]